MNTRHAKSPCCEAIVRRYGLRRRQCTRCVRTWRIRTKRRGRKTRRAHPHLAVRYLRRELSSLTVLAHRRGVSSEQVRVALVRSRDQFLRRTPWPFLPLSDPLILVADAFVRRIAGTWYTIHLMLLRELHRPEAVIAPPLIRRGSETQPGWREALGTLPRGTHARIAALVCDGHRGLVNYAKWEGWIIQRCHFHLLAAIQGRRSRWGRSRHWAEGQRLYCLVRRIITAPEGTDLLPLLTELETLGWETESPQLRKVISGFVNHPEEYRAYLRFPELHLPRTTGAVESLIGTVKDLSHRARGFCTLSAFTAWLYAVLKLKQTITCNGSHQPRFLG